jgi:SAM-dependent methyltransferase
MEVRQLVRNNRLLYATAKSVLKAKRAARHIVTYGVPNLLFDIRHGVDTRGLLALDDLTLKGAHGNEATRYLAVPESRFRSAIESLPIAYNDHIFVDIGSGKGRAVLLASQYPFRKVIGVEFAKELHEIALRNAAAWKLPRLCPVEFVWQDACEFEFPTAACVVFMFHPFGRAMVATVARKARSNGFSNILVYVSPEHAGALGDAEHLATSARHAYSTFLLPSAQRVA